MQSITIHPAQPDDVETAVPLIYSSGPDTFEFVFGHKNKGGACNFLKMAFIDGRGEFGYKNHIVVVQNGRIVGIGSAFSGQQMNSFTIRAAIQILRFYGPVAGTKIMRQGLQVEKVIQPPKGKLHYIAHLGVTPEYRGQGIGTQLIAWLLENGRQQKRTTASIDVSVENPKALALYKRLGFVQQVERTSSLKNDLGHVANHIYLERPLCENAKVL